MDKINQKQGRDPKINPKPHKCPYCKLNPISSKSTITFYRGNRKLNKTIFEILCVNPDCSHQPSTGPLNSKSVAVENWNNRVVCDGLFANGKS